MLAVSDVQLVQVLLFQQLKCVQILIAIKKEGGKVLLWTWMMHKQIGKNL